MVPHITTILQRFTGEWAMLLQPEAILAVCREIGYTTWRDRMLTPVTTVQLFLLQILPIPRSPALTGWSHHWSRSDRLERVMHFAASAPRNA